MDKTQLQEELTRAIQALAELDAAIDAQNWRVVGARIYELGRILAKVREELSA